MIEPGNLVRLPPLSRRLPHPRQSSPRQHLRPHEHTSSPQDTKSEHPRIKQGSKWQPQPRGGHLFSYPLPTSFTPSLTPPLRPQQLVPTTILSQIHPTLAPLQQGCPSRLCGCPAAPHKTPGVRGRRRKSGKRVPRIVGATKWPPPSPSCGSAKPLSKWCVHPSSEAPPAVPL